MAWFNSKAVLDDLSVAQGGRQVPVDILGVTAGLKPPSLMISEETEEEFFKDCVKGTQDTLLPNLYLIKEMLEVVQNKEGNLDHNPDTIWQVSKLNATAPECKPQTNLPVVPIVNETSQQTCNIKNRRKIRNMVLASLLSQEPKAQQPELSTKLIKPADFMEPVSKISDEQHRETDANSSMFRKRNVSSEMKLNKSELNGFAQPEKQFKLYTPSSYADQFYNKYVQRSKVKQFQDDIWSRASRQMKEIDMKRTLERDLLAAPALTDEGLPVSCDTDNQIFLKVSLPATRHLLAGPCVVCQVLRNKVSE